MSDNNMRNTFRGRPRYGQNYQGGSRYDSNYRDNYRNNMKGNQRYGRQNYNRDGFRGNFRNQSYERKRSVSYNRQTIGNSRRDNRSVSNRRSKSGSRASTNMDRIRCFECHEYDHFVRDCPTTQADRGRTNTTNGQYG